MSKLIMFFLCKFILFLVSIPTSDADAEECTLYLAPSKRPEMGRGVISGINLTSGALIDHSFGLLYPRNAITDNFRWQMLNYDWGYDRRKEENFDRSMMAIGSGSLFNHKQSPTVLLHAYEVNLNEEESIQTEAHATIPSIPYTIREDVEFGEELFVSYGDKWLEVREIIDVVNKTRPFLYTPGELKREGHCLTHVKVEKSGLPFAGEGLFAMKAFKRGEIIYVSPTLLMPKDEVIQLGTNTDSHIIIQNYCIASPDASIVLFPIGLGVIANHAPPSMVNMEIELYWWTDHEKKQNSSLVELSKSSSAELDLAYRATRDIAEGEELLVDYGEAWINAWASHLAELNLWQFANSAQVCDISTSSVCPLGIGKPRFLSFIGAPEKLYLSHWKDLPKSFTGDLA